MRYFLAFDAGTGSGRAVIFDQDGHEIAAVGQEWWHASDPRYPGSMDFDCDANWGHLARCAREAIATAGIDPAQIAGVSATSMREAFVLHDKTGAELWACANVDARADAEVRDLRAADPALEMALYTASGQTHALSALPRLLWLKRHMPEVLERATHLSMLSEWVLWRLSGELVAEPSNMGTSGLIALIDHKPVAAAFAQIGLSEALIPRMVASGTVVGAVSDAAARATGLRAGTPVVTGGGDCQIGTIGLGIVAEGDCAVLGGTFWQQVVNVRSDLTDPSMKLRLNPHVLPGLAQAEAISFFTGAVMRWFRDSFGQGRSYTELEEASRHIPPGAHGIIPIFSDIMRYGRWIHAAPSLLNLSLDPEKSGPAAIFRALQENAAVVAAANLRQVFALSGHTPDRIVFAGGAARSTHWAQILADVTGLPVVRSKISEATALGAAAAAAAGVGHFANLAEAGRAWSDLEAPQDPNPALRGLYDDQSARWSAAYAAQMALVEAGVTTSMWRAPGT